VPLIVFVTATGFLAAILLVWAELWVGIYKPHLPETVSLGLIWTYLAVILALTASGRAVYSWLGSRTKAIFKVEGLSIGLLVATFIMTLVDVGQSLCSVVIKSYRGIPLTQSLIASWPFEFRLFRTPFWISFEMAIANIFLIALFVVLFSWLGTKHHAFWIIELVVIFLLAIIFYTLV